MKLLIDPIKKLTQNLRTLLVRWKRDRFNDEQTYRRLLTTDDVISRTYGLTKIHKKTQPIESLYPLLTVHYYLSFFLHNIINDAYQKLLHIKTSFHLIEKLNGTVFDSQCFSYVLASLDVYLFTLLIFLLI